jgi:hypothetical protein
MLPVELLVSETLVFIKSNLLYMNNKRNMVKLRRNLMKSEFQQLRVEKAQEVSIKVEEYSTCWVCKKRISTSFYLIKQKHLVHLACKNKK